VISGSDLESLRAVFNEKEKELSVAVAKVDELTRQLEDLRRGNKDSPNGTLSNHIGSNGQSTASMELEKLRRELMVSKSHLFFEPTNLGWWSFCRSSGQDNNVDMRCLRLFVAFNYNWENGTGNSTEALLIALPGFLDTKSSMGKVIFTRKENARQSAFAKLS